MWQWEGPGLIFGSHAVIFTLCYFGHSPCSLHPTLLASSPPLWGLGYVKSQGGERITKLAIPASLKSNCSLWSTWSEEGGGWGFFSSGWELYFLAWQLYTKTPLSAISYIYCLFIAVFPTFLPLHVGLERQTYLLPQSDFWISQSTSGLPLQSFLDTLSLFQVSSFGNYSLPLICNLWSIWCPSVT